MTSKILEVLNRANTRNVVKGKAVVRHTHTCGTMVETNGEQDAITADLAVELYNMAPELLVAYERLQDDTVILNPVNPRAQKTKETSNNPTGNPSKP